LDRTLGPLVQGFLREYTRVAVGEASDFVMSPANRKLFGQANVKLIGSLLNRPVKTLLPSEDTSKKLINDTFEYVRSVKTEDLKNYVDFLYGYVGDKSIDRAVDVDRVIKASPKLKRIVDNIWIKATTNSSSSISVDSSN